MKRQANNKNATMLRGEALASPISEETHKCSLCGGTVYGYGNNPRPLCEGRCCNDCNAMYVRPYRIAMIRKADVKTWLRDTRWQRLQGRGNGLPLPHTPTLSAAGGENKAGNGQAECK